MRSSFFHQPIFAVALAALAVTLASCPLAASPLTDADKVYDSGDLKAAEAAYRKVLQDEPDNVFALEGLQSAIRFQPGKSSADAAPITARLDALRAHPVQRSKPDQQGDAFFGSHDYKHAEPYYRDALTADAKDNYARARLIDCLDAQGKAAESAVVSKDLQVARQASAAPAADRTKLEVGEKQLAAKQYDAAIQTFQSILKDAPDDKAVLTDLGAAFALSGHDAEARAIEARLKEAAKPQTAAPAVAKFPVAPAGMNGWLAKTQISAGGNLTATFYNITDGQVFEGPPNGAKSFDELRKADPGHCGTVTRDGDGLTFSFPGRPPEHHTLGSGLMDNSPLQKVTPMRAGNRFDGRFAIANSTSAGGVEATGIQVWTFHANGTVEHESTGAVYANAHHAGTGDAHAQANGASDQAERGSYTFNEGVMTLGPGTTPHSAWNLGDRTPPWYLVIDGQVFTAQQQ